ncbi:MAG: hypothetical protein QXT73_06770 [Candidatus Methanomethylicaceae archaeon]
MFKWEIRIGKKPRGLWRPEVKFRIWVIEGGYTTLKELNVPEEYVTEFGDACEGKVYRSCEECRRNVYADLGFAFYSSSSPRQNGLVCPPRKLKLAEYYTARLEWRPGKPDYTDIILKIKEHIIQPAIEWFQKQLTEAEASEPIEDIVISSDCINTTTKGGEKALPTRKVKL